MSQPPDDDVWFLVTGVVLVSLTWTCLLLLFFSFSTFF